MPLWCFKSLASRIHFHLDCINERGGHAHVLYGGEVMRLQNVTHLSNCGLEPVYVCEHMHVDAR